MPSSFDLTTTPVPEAAVSAAAAERVRMEPLFAAGDLPLAVTPAGTGFDLIGWAEQNREPLQQRLLRHGGILFRDTGLRDAAGLERFIQAVSGGALEYRERSSPRSVVAGNIYTSTDYPPSQP